MWCRKRRYRSRVNNTEPDILYICTCIPAYLVYIVNISKVIIITCRLSVVVDSVCTQKQNKYYSHARHFISKSPVVF